MYVFDSRNRNPYRLSLVLALLVLAHNTLDRWQFATDSPAIDFFTFWSVPHSLSMAPVANIYAPESQRQMATLLMSEAALPLTSDKQKRATAITSRLYVDRVDATGSPFLYTLVGLLSSGDFEKDQKTFATLSLVCSFVSIVLMSRLLRFSLVSTILALILLTSGYVPLVSDMGVGNINQIQLLTIALFVFFMARSRRFAAGLALGAGIMLKPNIFVIGLLSVLMCIADRDYRRQLRTVLGACAGVILSLLISGAFYGKAVTWTEFAKSLPHTLTVSYPLENGNLGLAMLVRQLTNRNASVFLLVALVAAFAYVVFRTRPGLSLAGHDGGSPGGGDPERALHEAFVAAGAGCAIMLLSSTLVWLHYYVLLIPMALYLVRPLSEDDPQAPRQVLVRLSAVAGLAMLSTWAHFFTESIMGSQLLEAIMLNTATALMMVLGLREMWFRRQKWATSSVPHGARPAVAMRGGSRRRRFRQDI